MRKRLYQQGSAHVVIIILLVLALLGALGFVFYQNFILKPAQPQAERVEREPSSKLKTAQFAYENTIYALDYPDGWSKTPIDPTNGQHGVAFADPSGEIEARIDVSDGGLGGMCDTNDGRKVRYYNVHPTANTKLTDETLYLVETMFDYLEGGYGYKIGLSPEGAETHSSVGDSHCTVGYVGVASRVVLDPSTNAVIKPTVITQIEFPKLPDAKDAKVTSMDIIKNLMKTEDYKAAVKILESARTE